MTSSLAFVLADLPTGDGDVLDRATLAAIVERVARRPSLWAARLDLRASVRTFASLHREPGLEVWAIAWLPESDTGWHDHDASSGAVHVVEGALDEHILRPGRHDRHSRYPAGHAFTFGPDHIHRVTCAGSRAVSVHAYSPALWRLGQYTLDDDGALRRLTVSYADELRPLDARAVVGR